MFSHIADRVAGCGKTETYPLPPGDAGAFGGLLPNFLAGFLTCSPPLGLGCFGSGGEF